jgi:hypothetical protein
MLLLLSHSILGLDVAFVSAFLSTENEFVTYGLLALCITLFDPLRAAVSACVFADARGRKDGADLHAAVDALLAAARPEPPASIRPSRPGLTAAGILLLGLIAAPVRAEPPSQSPPTAAAAEVANAAEPSFESSEDLEIRVAVERILKRREFDEFEPKGPRTFETWIRNLIDKLFSQNSDRPDEPRTLRVDLPDVSPWLVMSIVFGLLAFAVGYVSWESRGHSPALPQVPSPPSPPRISERPAPMLLSDARALATNGDFAGALRALYAATLAALDRARLIQFDPARTNGHYLRSMPAGATRDAFAAFTSLFDRKWYGREECTRAEYERSLELAERICAVPSVRPAAREVGSKRP